MFVRIVHRVRAANDDDYGRDDSGSEFGDVDVDEISVDSQHNEPKPRKTNVIAADMDDEDADDDDKYDDDDTDEPQSKRRGRPPLVTPVNQRPIDDWLATLSAQPTSEMITHECRRINADDKRCAVTIDMLEKALKKHNSAQMAVFMSGGTPSIDLTSWTFFFRDDETEEISNLLKTMDHTNDRQVAPLIAKFNVVRAAARVPLVTNQRMTNKCSKLREVKRAVRSKKEPVWPLSCGSHAVYTSMLTPRDRSCAHRVQKADQQVSQDCAQHQHAAGAGQSVGGAAAAAIERARGRAHAARRRVSAARAAAALDVDCARRRQ
jgi:hypothetical protein